MPFSPRLAYAADPKCDSTNAVDEARPARKTARKAARATQLEESEGKLNKVAARKARKTAKNAGRVATNVEKLEVDPVAEKKVVRKAVRKAARAAAHDKSQETSTPDVVSGAVSSLSGKKRKACSGDLRSSVDAKQRRSAEGKAIATKELGSVAFRKLHEIIVDASCPAPFETFDAAAPMLGGALAQALLSQGYTAPSPIQAQSWPIALAGKDMVAVAKTGSGKTCGFLLPALARIAERGPAPSPEQVSWEKSVPARPSVLVVAPTRELALQIGGEADKFAPAVRARVVVLYGGTPKGPQVVALRQGADIVIATPGRLNDLCAGDTKRGISPCISLEAVTYLVLDEADQMLDMGFEPAIREIVARCPKTGAPEEGGGASGARGGSKRQTLFFTATWPKKVQAVASTFTSKSAVQVRIGQGGAEGDKLTLNKSVRHEVVMSEFKQKVGTLQNYLKQSFGPKESAVVFAATKGACNFLEQKMGEAFKGMWCRAIHGDKEQWEREQILCEFRTNVAGGQQAVLVATDVAARGLDIPGISLVVVYDFSFNRQPAGIAVENFVHRVGRTGRAGKTGRALTLWSSDDKGAPELVKLLEGAGQKVSKQLKDMAAWERPAGKGRQNNGWAKSWW